MEYDQTSDQSEQGQWLRKANINDESDLMRIIENYMRLIKNLNFSQFNDQLIELEKFKENFDSKIKVRVLITGRTSAGKSSLINAILGQKIMPIDIHSSTMCPIMVRHSETDFSLSESNIVNGMFYKKKGGMTITGRQQILQYLTNIFIQQKKSLQQQQQQILQNKEQQNKQEVIVNKCEVVHTKTKIFDNNLVNHKPFLEINQDQKKKYQKIFDNSVNTQNINDLQDQQKYILNLNNEIAVDGSQQKQNNACRQIQLQNNQQDSSQYYIVNNKNSAFYNQDIYIQQNQQLKQKQKQIQQTQTFNLNEYKSNTKETQKQCKKTDQLDSFILECPIKFIQNYPPIFLKNVEIIDMPGDDEFQDNMQLYTDLFQLTSLKVIVMAYDKLTGDQSKENIQDLIQTSLTGKFGMIIINKYDMAAQHEMNTEKQAHQLLMQLFEEEIRNTIKDGEKNIPKQIQPNWLYISAKNALLETFKFSDDEDLKRLYLEEQYKKARDQEYLSIKQQHSDWWNDVKFLKFAQRESESIEEEIKECNYSLMNSPAYITSGFAKFFQRLQQEIMEKALWVQFLSEKQKKIMSINLIKNIQFQPSEKQEILSRIQDKAFLESLMQNSQCLLTSFINQVIYQFDDKFEESKELLNEKKKQLLNSWSLDFDRNLNVVLKEIGSDLEVMIQKFLEDFEYNFKFTIQNNFMKIVGGGEKYFNQELLQHLFNIINKHGFRQSLIKEFLEINCNNLQKIYQLFAFIALLIPFSSIFGGIIYGISSFTKKSRAEKSLQEKIQMVESHQKSINMILVTLQIKIEKDIEDTIFRICDLFKYLFDN